MMKTAGGEDGELDLRGLKCPLPALKTRKTLAAMASMQRLVVLADDPLARLDIAHLCATEGHDLLAIEQRDAHLRFLIVRR